MPKCIYCGSSGPFSEEHPLPACLGEFEGAPMLLERVCKDCNRAIGKAEEQFCRAGPEAFFRVYFGVEGRKSHDKVNPFERGSAGASAIDLVAPHPESGIPVLWELNKGEAKVREVRQIVVVDANGDAHQIRIRQWMKRPEQLQEQIRELGVDVQKAYIFASDDEVEWVQRLVSGIGGSVTWFSQPEGAVIDKPIARVQVTTSYMRALAKIGSHYLLATKLEVSGEAPEFDHVKQFIRHGRGNADNFFREESGCLVGRPSSGHRPERNVHIVVAEWRDGYVEARMQFFFGPKYEPPVYRIGLARNVQALGGRGAVGHCYGYFKDGPRGKYAGDVSELIAQSRSGSD